MIIIILIRELTKIFTKHVCLFVCMYFISTNYIYFTYINC